MQHAQSAGGDITLPQGTWVLYLAGQFNTNVSNRYDATFGSCSTFVQFNKMNHFGINNFNPNTSSAQVRH